MSIMWLMLHKYIDMEYNKFENHIANVLRQDQAEMDIDSFINDLHKKRSRRYPVWIWTVSYTHLDVYKRQENFVVKCLKEKD